ncbi:glutamyl aminopeptidase-like [Galleria mellonella]|uniref:Glutamyl aminopeptidase-like n=1 Tax=Galleria mellonella TaxID=7137 RepID=A0A6J1WM16_GALME|nr:glutamyl aminopeptidase-like [Galleria mellonella]
MILRALSFLFLLSVVNAYYLNEEECLNYTVYPVQYEIKLFVSKSYYDCQIKITVIANALNVNMIELDANDLKINFDSLKVYKENVDIVNRPRPYEYDRMNGKLYIYLREPLIRYSKESPQYYIVMMFRKYLTEETEGIFLVPYKDVSGKIKYSVTTRLSPNRAKYFFPCFDNPRFEAVFKFIVHMMTPLIVEESVNNSLTITKEQRNQTMQDQSVIVYYTPSPQVKLNEIGLHISDFSNIKKPSKNTKDTLVVWAPEHELENYRCVLNYGVDMINLIHKYAAVDRPLANGPINIIAVPSEKIDGYEVGSWNLLTYRANRLACREEYSSIKQINRMNFELAQQLCRIWLGNPGETERTRWREEWFKEGVATYLAYYFLAQYNQQHRHTTYNQEIAKYGLEMKIKAMETDWHRSTPALASFNNTLAIEIPSRYKNLVTMKTASILWMVENWIGSEKFHQALVKYINSRRGKFISLKDFYEKLDFETVECELQFFNGSTASRVLSSWFHHPGYPVVDVQVLRDNSDDRVLLNQRYFSFIDRRRESDYLIPISYIMQHNQNCYNCYQPRFTIGRQTYSFRENLNGGWIILNRNSSGYYRVNYDVYTWKLIAKTLNEDHNSIDELTRAQLVNDAFALYVSGDINQDLAMEILDYLHNERSPAVWESAIAGFELLKTENARCNMTKILYEEWKEFMRRKIAPIYNIISDNIEQDGTSRLFRSNVVSLACALQYEPCRQRLQYTYEQYRRNGMRIDPDIREACYRMLLKTNGYFGVHPMNAFEKDDRLMVEQRLREENRFLMKLPKGEPRPMPIRSTTTSTTLPPLPIVDKQTAGSTSISPTVFIIVITALIALMNR